MNMGVSKKKLSWSELCPDLLGCFFERLSFRDLIQAKSVCSSWNSASRGYLPKRNHQIPWLILLPSNGSSKENNSSCLFLVPEEDKDRVYKNRDLGVDFFQSRCLASYGSWLLMMDHLWNLNILNPLTGERIDLPPLTGPKKSRPKLKSSVACLWIDEKTKDYLVVWKMIRFLVFTKKGSNMWRRISSNYAESYEQMVYNHKAQKLYVYSPDGRVNIWCFCEDEPEEVFEGKFDCGAINIGFSELGFLPDGLWQEISRKEKDLFWEDYVNHWINFAITVSGQVLKVASLVQRSKRWLFRLHKVSHVTKLWEQIDSLGDEALILDMGITVVAKGIPGIKRNSIYFSGVGYGRKDPDHIFVFDLTTQNIQRLQQCPINFSDARWFFPGSK